MSCLLYWTSDFVLYLAAGAAYLLFRDAIRGQSVGKFILGLVVISLETGRPSSLVGSVRRNLLLLLPGANVVAIFLEVQTVVRDPQGQPLGDRLAQTQVVEGFGAKDLVMEVRGLLDSEVDRACYHCHQLLEGRSKAVKAMERITTDPEQCGGRPCIRGMRIRVIDVLDLFAAGLSSEQILEELPDLEMEDLKAVLTYAARRLDHPVLVV